MPFADEWKGTSTGSLCNYLSLREEDDLCGLDALTINTYSGVYKGLQSNALVKGTSSSHALKWFSGKVVALSNPLFRDGGTGATWGSSFRQNQDLERKNRVHAEGTSTKSGK